MNIEKYLKTERTFIPTVVGYLVKDNSVILGRRVKVSNNLGPGLIAGVGGKPESGETNEEAFVREFIEEFGTDKDGNIVCKPSKFESSGTITYLNVNNKYDFVMEIFVCTEWEGTPVASDAMEPVGPYAFDDIPFDEMWEDNKLFLNKVLYGQIVQGTVLYEDGKIKEYYFES